MKKFLLLFLLSSSATWGICQNKSKYFPQYNESLNKLYWRYQCLVPVGSFYSKANAKVGQGFEIGKIQMLNVVTDADYKIGIDYTAGIAFNQINLRSVTQANNSSINYTGNYTSLDFMLGPTLYTKLNDKIALYTSLQAGPNIFTAPAAFSYNVDISGKTYTVVDGRDQDKYSINDWFRTRKSITVVAVSDRLMVGLKYSSCKFRSPRKIETNPYIDFDDEYTLISRAGSIRLIVGLSF